MVGFFWGGEGQLSRSFQGSLSCSPEGPELHAARPCSPSKLPYSLASGPILVSHGVREGWD